MGFTSQDDLINEITNNGKYLQAVGQKVSAPAHTAGGWHAWFGMAGFPGATTYPAAADLVCQVCTEAGGDAAGATILGMQNGGPVLSDTKHVLATSGLIVAAAGAPWMLRLVDLECYYRLATTNVTGTGSRTLINTNTFTANAGTDVITYTNDWSPFTKVRFTTTGTLPAGLALNTDYWLIRASTTTATVASSYINALAGTFVDITDTGTGTHTLTVQRRNQDGVGCEAYFVVQTAPATGGPNLTASSYTNAAGTAGRAFQGSPTNGAAADAYATRITHSGNAAGRYGPFLPKQGADTGVRSIESFTWSGGTAYTGSGVVALCIAKPLCDIMLPVTGALCERDLVNQIVSMPQVVDGACLGWLMFSAGATTTNSPVLANFSVAWG